MKSTQYTTYTTQCNLFYDACATGNQELIDFMISKSNVPKHLWHSGLEGACFGGQLKLMQDIISRGLSTDWESGLYGACLGGQLEIADLMLSKGAKKHLEAAFESALEGGNPEVINLLISKGGKMQGLLRLAKKASLEIFMEYYKLYSVYANDHFHNAKGVCEHGVRDIRILEWLLTQHYECLTQHHGCLTQHNGCLTQHYGCSTDEWSQLLDYACSSDNASLMKHILRVGTFSDFEPALKSLIGNDNDLNDIDAVEITEILVSKGAKFTRQHVLNLLYNNGHPEILKYAVKWCLEHYGATYFTQNDFNDILKTVSDNYGDFEIMIYFVELDKRFKDAMSKIFDNRKRWCSRFSVDMCEWGLKLKYLELFDIDVFKRIESFRSELSIRLSRFLIKDVIRLVKDYSVL